MRLRLIVLLASFAVARSVAAETIVVGLGEAFTEIQPALDAAKDGDQVLVKPGEYLIAEPINFNRLHNRKDPASPPVKNFIVKSEGGAEVTRIRLGVPANTSRGMVVIFESGEGPTSLLEGFTIEGGKGGDRQGGIFCWGSSPTITGCTISGNSGTGVTCSDSAAALINCTISGNISLQESPAVICGANSPATLTRCTISGNSGSGLYCFFSSPRITNCIIWDNAGGSVVHDQTDQPVIDHSCIEGDAPQPGEGNIALDPLFCGWGSRDEVWVDSSQHVLGDGTAPNPYPDVRLAAVGFSLALSEDSPCLGSGMGGADMGSSTGRCAGPAGKARTVHLASGTYPAADVELVHKVSLLGAGQGKTVIDGALRRLRTGAIFSGFTINGNDSGGIRIGPEQRPAIFRCTISGSSGSAVSCRGSTSSPASALLTDCEISGNLGTGLNCEGSSPSLTDCLISRNGEGISCSFDASPVLIGCTISGNSRVGLTCRESSSPILKNCTISRNLFGGISSAGNSSPTLTNCTIAWNPEGGLRCSDASSPAVTSCILWDNIGGSLVRQATSHPVITYSCIEGTPVWAGEGNINQDPLFCGGWQKQEVWLDPSWAVSGDGSEGNPFSDPLQVMNGYSASLALSVSSPCWGRGKGGSDIGAFSGLCGASRAGALTVHLASATYRSDDFDLTPRVSLLGSGEGKTMLEGTVRNLRTGTRLSNLTVTGGQDGGIVVAARESPLISDCTIAGNSARFGPAGGVICERDSSPALVNCSISANTGTGVSFSIDSSPTLTNCTISENSGSGVVSWSSSGRLVNCTISGNLAHDGGGVELEGNSSPTLTNCIVWENAGGSLRNFGTGQPVVTYCCMDGKAAIPGEGNIATDPQFCGWPGSDEVWVDPSRPAPGDGSEGNPYPDARASTIGYSLALSETSPCLGTGMGGADMGSANGRCGGMPGKARTVHLATGIFQIEDLNLVHKVSLLGSGEDLTWIEGTVRVLRAGAFLSNLTVTGGDGGGILIDSGESPEITNCTITGTSGNGFYCFNSSPTLRNCKISGNSHSGIFCAQSSPTLIGCTISGNSESGVGLQQNSSPTLTSCTISENSFTGVFCSESSPTLNGCAIWGNSGKRNSDGGVVCTGSSTATLTHCTVSGNIGSGILNVEYSALTLTSCIVWDNLGGSVVNYGTGRPVITHSCIEGEPLWAGEGNINQDPLFCGGWERAEVWVDPSRVSPGDGTEVNPFVDPRRAVAEYSLSFALAASSPCRGSGQGGSDMGSDEGSCDGPLGKARTIHLAPGIYRAEDLGLFHQVSLLGAGAGKTVIKGTVGNLRTGALLSNLTVTGGNHGGILIFPGESPEIANCTISENLGMGVICSGGPSPKITNCMISGNSDAGLLVSEGSSPTVNHCTFARNGIGVACSASFAALTDCTISGNLQIGLYCDKVTSTIINRCTIAGNSGIGVYCINSTLTFLSCAISRNSDSGVYCLVKSFPTLTNCTVSANTGAGFVGWRSSPKLTNCIVWGNGKGSVGSSDGSHPAINHSCIEGAPVWPGDGNIAEDPRFAIQGDYHLLPDSPAIDAGTSAGAPTTDIEGHRRPCGNGIDMGAHEVGDCAPPVRFKRGKVEGTGEIELTDVIVTLNRLFLGQVELTCRAAADSNADGRLDIADPIYSLLFLYVGGSPPPSPYPECDFDSMIDGLGCEEYKGCD